VVGSIPPNAKYEVKTLAQGTVVNGVDTWYKILHGSTWGFINGSYVREIKQNDCTEVQNQLNSCNSEKKHLEEQISIQNEVITKLNDDLGTCKNDTINKLTDALNKEYKKLV